MRTRAHIVERLAPAAAALGAAATPLLAQEMEPRACAASPKGMNFATASITRSSGGVAVDPMLPLENVDATVNALSVGFRRTFRRSLRVAANRNSYRGGQTTIDGERLADLQKSSRCGADFTTYGLMWPQA